MSYKEKRELESLPTLIETIDAQLAELHTAMAQPDFYKQPSAEIVQKQGQLKLLEEQLANSYRRWEELEAIAD